MEDCLKGCIKLHPKSTIPNSLSFLFSIPEMNWQHKSLSVKYLISLLWYYLQTPAIELYSQFYVSGREKEKKIKYYKHILPYQSLKKDKFNAFL